MRAGEWARSAGRASIVTALSITMLTACAKESPPMDAAKLRDFATRYTAAWNSKNPANVASFFAENGSLTINNGKPAVGRAAIAVDAQGFFTAFPDLVLTMDSLRVDGAHAFYHWTFTGTNTGPGGTGKAVRVSGYEEWTTGADGLVARSLGHFDAADYARQLKEGIAGAR